ncbi:LuxR C-terminal-related transcriptional regulator [Streptomyces sp. GXMU-J15]|uniref:LuxR C-terminal-related transcriptional regulator n=1 Tax=Streptomyces fuscus TaxID=3048495 RepID=A0ABT7J4X3_9ACTN|nr:LuxR C-terminal-related transcriptional regulator [Streptomyces fuscus]MDL2079926.1 LuxR C-terminal-related transcriptional regulator [Streptomyces fuscus]
MRSNGQPVRDGAIPADLTAFIGRRAEVAAVKGLLRTSRLVTLTGVGGVGKTRLALQVGAGATGAFPDGVALVELAGLADPGLVVETLAAALGLQNQRARVTLDVVAEHLRPRKALLVVDNCEHLADACAQVLGALLGAAPDLRVLATSRQVLGITGEQTFPVPPLPVPAPDGAPDAEELLRYHSVTLFEQRAAAVLPGFRVTADNAADVARLVHRLDGLPLALELAAGRIRSLTLKEILARLEDRFALLTGGSRAASPRQQTLSGLMDWSYDLCSPREQALWARLSVFPGDFDLEAAEAVCAGADLPAHAVVDAVHGLVEKSILNRQEHDGRARYHALETVRAYGRQRLAASGELALHRRRHREHCLDLAARAQRHWFGPEQVTWLARLRREHANLRAALDFCLDTPGEASAGLTLASLPHHYWITHGALSEGRRWLSRLLAADQEPGAARTRALGTYAYLGIMQGAVAETVPVIAEYERAAEEARDASALAWSRHHRAMAAVFSGELTRAAQLLEDAVRRHRAVDDPAGAAECGFKLAVVVGLLGDTDRALELCQESQDVTAAHGESWIRADALFAESLIRWQRGERARADAPAREALRLLRPLTDRWGIALCVEVVAWNAAADGAMERAARLLGILRRLWEAIGGTLFAAPFMTESHRRCETDVRRALPERVYERAVRRGAGLTLDEALAYVLEESPADEEPYERAGLTRREREVAGLVAAGLSNKEIAARLLITRRTVESHVGRTLAKLGLTSRSQLTAWAHRRRSAD